MSNRGSRWQRGTLARSGENWILRIREDVTGEDGSTRRRERSVHVASCADVRTRTQARSLADVLADRITGRGLTPGASMVASEYLRRYIAEHLVSKKPASQSTIKGRIRQHLVPVVGRLRLEQINGRTAQKLVKSMLERKLHSTTIRDTVRLLALILKRAKQDGLACQLIDVRAVSMPAKAEAYVERQAYTAAEVVRLLEGSKFPWRMAYTLQATIGLRCAEVLGLAWRDFDADTVAIRRSAVLGRIQSLKTSGSAKRLALPTTVRQMLDEYRVGWRPNAQDLLFVTRNNRAVHSSWYRAQLIKDMKRLGITYRGTHAFRHFTATQLLACGQSAAAVRDQLRHSNVSMTNTYAHTVSGDLRKGADLMGALLKQQPLSDARLAGACGSTPISNTATQG